MSYRLLALDLDGTLVRESGDVHPDDSAAVARLQASGVPVAVVTGRLWSGTQALVRELDLSGPHACADGAEVVAHPGSRLLAYEGLPSPVLAPLRRALASPALAVFPMVHGEIFLDARGAAFGHIVRSWSDQVVRVADALEHPCWTGNPGPSVVLAIGTRAVVEEVAGHVAGLDLEVLRYDRDSGENALIFHAPGVGKGQAVRWLADHHGCDPSEVVAVGDWLNDVAMFEVAGRSFAMAGSEPAALEAATDVLRAQRGRGGGVAEAIARAWGTMA